MMNNFSIDYVRALVILRKTSHAVGHEASDLRLQHIDGSFWSARVVIKNQLNDVHTHDMVWLFMSNGLVFFSLLSSDIFTFNVTQ